MSVIKYENIKNYNLLKNKYKKKKFNVIEINGEIIQSENDLYDLFNRTIYLPEYFGNNWNALLDCLVSLEWLNNKNCVVFLTNKEKISDVKLIENMIGVLQTTVKYWEKKGGHFDFFVIEMMGEKSLFLIKLIDSFLRNKIQIDDFCKRYTFFYEDNSSIIQKEVSLKIYNLLSEIHTHIAYFEPSDKTREADSVYLNEENLRKNVAEAFLKIKSLITW